MMQSGILDEFYEKDVQPRLIEILEELEQEFQKHRFELKENYIKQFDVLCAAAKKVQMAQKFPVGFLMFQVLRTRLLQHDYRYQVVIYNEEWYIQEGFPVGDFDVSFVYQYYEKLWQELRREYRKYIGKLTEIDVEQMMLRVLDEFHNYVVELLRYGLLDALESESYLQLEKADTFHIQSGELMEPSDFIHIEEKEKMINKVLRWLDQNKERDYCFSDFRGLDFRTASYQAMDLRYIDFRESNLEEAHFSVCMFYGTKFRNCNMKRANLMLSVIAGADFAGADLTGANLANCVSYTGKKIINRWKKVGYTETSFRNCNLTNVNFTGAVLHEADFTGAILTETDFTGASLSKSRFTKEGSVQCGLSREQLEQIFIL